MEGIIDLHTRRIVTHRGPDMRDTALRPRLERHQQSLGIQFPELLGLRTEAGPDRYHEVGMLLVHVLNHLLAIRKVLREEVHRVPQIVRAPVLPVLDDTIEGHLQSTILVDNALRLTSSLITLLRLPIAVSPQGEHRHITCQLAHQGNITVGTSAIHKVVVHALAGL